MAGKNEVTLTFAGDSDKLEKEIRKVTGSTGDLEQAFDKVGAAAKRSEDQLSGVGGGTERLNKLVGSGGRAFGDYGTGLAGVGDRADEVDTRMMGLSDGIQGVTDLMHRDKLKPHEFAMAFSDLGSAMYNTVIPSLQSGVKMFTALGKSIGAMGGVQIAAVAVGVTALAIGLKKLDENRAKERLEETNKALKETGEISDKAAEQILAVTAKTGDWDKMLQQVADVGGYKAAEALVKQAELLGADEASMRSLNSELSELKEKYASTAESVSSFNDALQAQQDKQRALTDPMFASIEASRELAAAKQSEFEAQSALNEALKGSDPAAVAEAQQALEDAHLDVANAALGSQSAEEQLFTALATGQTSVAEMRARVDELERSNGLSAASAGYLRDQINSIESKNVTIGLSGYGAVKGQLDALYATLSAMPESKTIRLGYSSYGIAELNRFRALGGGYNGAIVPGYAAGGGLSWSSGPRGTDRVPMWLTPGEMVLNKGQQQNLFDAIDSGAIGGHVAARQTVVNVSLNVAGSIHSDRDLVKIIRDEVARGGLRGVLR